MKSIRQLLLFQILLPESNTSLTPGNSPHHTNLLFLELGPNKVKQLLAIITFYDYLSARNLLIIEVCLE